MKRPAPCCILAILIMYILQFLQAKPVGYANTGLSPHQHILKRVPIQCCFFTHEGHFNFSDVQKITGTIKRDIQEVFLGSAGHDDRKVGLTAFISTGQEGYQYEVHGKVRLLATFPYTANCLQVKHNIIIKVGFIITSHVDTTYSCTLEYLLINNTNVVGRHFKKCALLRDLQVLVDRTLVTNAVVVCLIRYLISGHNVIID